MRWAQTINGKWLHRPWWKRLINHVLRWLQPRQRWKWLVYTDADVLTERQPAHRRMT